MVEAGAHLGARLAGLNAAIPRGARVMNLAEDALGNLARGLVAHLMTASAAVGVDDLANPLALALDGGRNTVPVVPRAGEIALGRHLHQREPVQRGIVFDGSLLVRRQDRLQVKVLARCRISSSANLPARSREPTHCSSPWEDPVPGSAPDRR